MQLMKKDYKTTIEDLFRRRPKKQQLQSDAWRLLKEWGNPQQAYPIVHIAGTNGKGQIASKIAFALQQGGYKVGLFTSPHLFNFEERITINEWTIPREKVVDYDAELVDLAQQLELDPNFFEYATCMGFRYFKEEQVDIAVIEAGLGGLHDSTNVVEPILSIITSISFDHEEYLGYSLEEIAAHKAGIIKPNTPVVLGPHAQLLPMFQQGKAVDAPIHCVECKSCFYDTENQAVAKEALSILSKRFPMNEECVKKGLKYMLPCRFDKRGNVIYDVAHNPDGFSHLMSGLKYLFPHQKFRFVVGMVAFKDLKGCLEKIKDEVEHIHFVSAKRENSASPEELGHVFQSISSAPFSVERSIEEGMKKAKAATPKDQILVVCGSFYIMADAINSP